MATVDTQTALYDKDTGNRLFFYVQLQVERVMGGICLSLVWNSNTVKVCQPQISRLVKSLRGEKVAGVIGEDWRENFWREI